MWASGARLETTCDSTVLSMDWKESSSGCGGWLATGSAGGTVGISWISYDQGREDDSRETGGCFMEEGEGSLFKSHFILRGHIGEVQIVKWMPNGIRLASYDSWGRIILWSNRAHVLAYEFQINTAVLVTDIRWSPCGFYLMACAKSGHIMSFSGVNGMSLFSVQIEAAAHHAKKAKLTCCSWNKPGTRVAFGTSNGEIIVLNPADRGTSLTTITINQGVPVQSLDWYGSIVQCQKPNAAPYLSQGFSVCLRNGDCVFFQSPGCTECVYSKTGVVDGRAAWTSDESMMVVIGYSRDRKRSIPIARFLNHTGYVVFTVSEDLPVLPKSQFPMKNVLWSLQNSTVVLSCGPHIYSLKTDHSLPTLESLCRYTILSKIASEGEDVRVELLPLPSQEIKKLTSIKEPLIPNLFNIESPDIFTYLYEPVPHNHRVHCILESIENGGYVLKLEHCNLYVPLLHAKRKPGKRASVQCSYIIEPAFDCSQSKEDDDWADSVSSCSIGVETGLSTRRRPSFLKRVWSALNPVHGHGVMDATPTCAGASAANVGSTTQEKMILAEVEGNSFINRFKFHTTSPLFQDGFLGSVNICTNYIKCKPRKISVVLPSVGTEAADELSFLSKEPEWNDNFQIYELDFGGRVSRDSIKNFQIEHGGKVVLQFGKADIRRFCLDFQAPFSVIQAMCIAVSSIL